MDDVCIAWMTDENDMLLGNAFLLPLQQVLRDNLHDSINRNNGWYESSSTNVCSQPNRKKVLIIAFKDNEQTLIKYWT